MSVPILKSKLYIPQLGSNIVSRPRLVNRLIEGMEYKLTLISAPAGFGKTTLLNEWAAGCKRPVAWLSMDKEDNDPIRFLLYIMAALQTISISIGAGEQGFFQVPQLAHVNPVLIAMLNQITDVADDFTLVIDDYHVIDSKPVDDVLAFLIEHLPPKMHLLIATREDPHFPLARLRVQGQMVELHADDLRFTSSETFDFLNQVMNLNLPEKDVSELEIRTEGWIAGLQLAALSMKGNKDSTGFIRSFMGNHHFVLDYLIDEVLNQQTEDILLFLTRTSILDRMCGSLCDAVILNATVSGQEILEHLEHANLFIIPLDNERRWYRYHHLFADLLRQQLLKKTASPDGDAQKEVSELHLRASIWYENNGYELDAFHHAVAAGDVERAEFLVEGKGMPLYYRGMAAPIINWLKSLPKTVLDGRPSLWVTYASALMISGNPERVEEKARAAEAVMQNGESDKETRNLMGQLAAMRALVATSQNDADAITDQAHRALEYLDSGNLPVRTAAFFALGYSCQLKGNHTEASRAYAEVISIGRTTGNLMFTIAASFSLGKIQEAGNQLYLAAESYRNILQLVDNPEQESAIEAHIGLARIYYEWNDLNAAEKHLRIFIRLASQIECYTTVPGEVLLARLKLARGDKSGALDILVKAEQFIHQNSIAGQLSEIASVKALILLRQNNLEAAAMLARAHKLPLSEARIYLAQGDASAALAALESICQPAGSGNSANERLNILVLQAMTLDALGEKSKALSVMADALALAEAGGFIRVFVDEGFPMARLLMAAAAHEIMPDYVVKLLDAFEAEEKNAENKTHSDYSNFLKEQFSLRELEILKLIAAGLSNREISGRLYLALPTVKWYNQSIFHKLDVKRRTEAVARARACGLL